MWVIRVKKENCRDIYAVGYFIRSSYRSEAAEDQFQHIFTYTTLGAASDQVHYLNGGSK